MDKTDQADYPLLRLSQKQRRRQILCKKKARSYCGKKERLQRKLEAMGKEKENVGNKVSFFARKMRLLQGMHDLVAKHCMFRLLN